MHFITNAVHPLSPVNSKQTAFCEAYKTQPLTHGNAN